MWGSNLRLISVYPMYQEVFMPSKGIKTTEFWIVVSYTGLMVLNEGATLRPNHWVFGAVIIYVGGCTWLKTKV